MVLQFAGEIIAQRGKPVELVPVLLGFETLAVWHVQVDDAKVFYRRRQNTALRVAKPRNFDDRVGHWPAADRGHAVVGFLSVCKGVKSRLANGVQWKCFRQLLDFLQNQNVRFRRLHPLENLGKPYRQGVDVPGSNLHAASSIPLWRNSASTVGCLPRNAT